MIQIKDFHAFSNFVYSFTWTSHSEWISYLVHLDIFAVMNLWAIRFLMEQNLVHAEFIAEIDVLPPSAFIHI